MQISRDSLNRGIVLLLTLCGLTLFGTPAGLASEQRVWKGKNGSTFEGHFLTVDQKTGNYVFMDLQGEFVRVAPDNLTDESRAWVAEELKAEAEASDHSKRPRAAADGALVFSKPAVCARDWTNSKGKTVNGILLSATQEEVKMEVRGQPATVRLEDLQEEDRAAALLWTGATNEPLSFPGGIFHYGVSCGGEEVLSFSVEISGNLSRTTMEYVEVLTGFTPKGEQRKVVNEVKMSLTTDHASGAFQIARWKKNQGWVKTSIGRWHPLDHREEIALPPRRADWLRRVLPEIEVAAAGPWLARRLVLEDKLDPTPLFNEWIKSNQLALVRFADSKLPAALRLVLETPTVADTAPPDPTLVAPKTRRVLPFLPSVVNYPPLDGVLGALQAHELAPVAWSFEVPNGRGSKKVKAGKYVVALKRVDFKVPEASSFEIDPEAAGMEEGSYKASRQAR